MMNEITFVERVKKNYGHLMSEYGFKITTENNSEIRPHTDGIVEYTSTNTVVVIDSETGSASVWFYRVKDGRRYYLDPVAIHEYLNTSSAEKKLLLSTSSSDAPAATTLFNRIFLLNQSEWKSSDTTTREKLEKRLANYAAWLKEHADLCLKDNFSRWPAFYEYKINRARADHLRLRKDEMGYARVKDADGNSKLVEQSIFKDKLDYAEKLKKEFS